MSLFLVRLDERRLVDFERLHSGKGFGGCYCAVWSRGADPAAWEERCSTRAQDNLEETKKRVRSGEHIGYLAFREDDGSVVGWTRSGPKSGFAGADWWPGCSMGSMGEGVWAVGCLAIAYEHRSRGFAREMLALVVEEARRSGASSIEGFPKEPCGEDGGWCGTKALFEGAGFAAVEERPAGADAKFLRMEKPLS